MKLVINRERQQSDTLRGANGRMGCVVAVKTIGYVLPFDCNDSLVSTQRYAQWCIHKRNTKININNITVTLYLPSHSGGSSFP